MRLPWLVVVGIGFAGIGAKIGFAGIGLAACGHSDQRAVENRAAPSIEAPMTDTADDKQEWLLLGELVASTRVASREAARAPLGKLEAFYSSRGAWDEYSTVKALLLELAPIQTSPGPAPGGPFPRIGAPRSGPRPHTVLSRWLNRELLPALYAKKELSPADLVVQLRLEIAAGESARLYRELGDALCANLRFFEAEPAYTYTLKLDPDQKAVRERLAGVRRILGAR